MENLYKRKIYDKILEWKKWDGQYALLVEGARRVGKSTIVRQFAENEYKSHIIIDFSKASAEVRCLFDDLDDLNFLFLKLQTIYGVSLHRRQSVIVFDEVQFAPKARQAIKHLVADGRYDYIETGSLISIKKNVKDILIPSEEYRIEMYPMDYEEFLWAIGKADLPDLLRKMLKAAKPIGDVVNRNLMRDFRLYMLVGGMPQSVSAYIKYNDFSRVDEVKRRIINLYEEDFVKIDPTGRISAMFDAIPANLSNNTSRYKPHAVVESDTDSMTEMIVEMSSSMTVNLCYHATDPGPMLSAYYDMRRFKMYVGDTGLFVTLAFKNSSYTDNIIYRKLLSDKLEANLGYVYENVAAQILRASGKKLFYYTFPNAAASGYYEVDFVVTDGHKIDPIEIKSSSYTRYASLDAFSGKFSSRIQQAYCISPKDRSRKGPVLNLPFYLLPFLF